MSNEFNAKNGLRIKWGQPVTGITNNDLIEDNNSLATEGQVYRELTAKTDNSVFDAYTASTGGSSGNVTGDTSSIDNAITRFDGTSGKLIQNSTATTLDDIGNLVTTSLSATTISGDIIYQNNEKVATENFSIAMVIALG